MLRLERFKPLERMDIGLHIHPPLDRSRPAHGRERHLQRFEKNFRKGELDDLTLPLLTDSALKEARIPPGPRLRILQFSAYQRSVAAAARPNQAVGHMSLALPI